MGEALQNSLEATWDEALTFNEVEAFGTGVSVRLGVSWPTGNLPSQCDRDSFNVNQATRCLRAVLGGSNGEQASYDADEIRSALETGLETTGDNSFSAPELEAFGSGLAVRLGTSLPESYPQVCKRRNFNVNQAIRCLNAIFGDDEVASYDAEEIQAALETGLETTGDNSFSASELEAFGSGLAVRLGTSLPESYPQVCK